MPLNFPAGVKIIGANITSTAAYGATLTPWRLQWLNFDAIWPTFLKPQIDNMVGNGIGVNTFRIVGCNWGVLSGHYSQAYYDDRVYQVASYLKSIGCYFYFNFGWIDGGVGGGGETVYGTIADIATSAASTIRQIQGLGNVIGCDLFNEAQGGGFSNGFITQTIAAAKALGANIPFTCSSSSTSDPISPSTGSTWLNSIAASLDYIDVHLYDGAYPNANAPVINYFNYFRANFPTKQILIGEFGLTQTFTQDQRNAYFDACLKIITLPDPMMAGGLAWCCRPDVQDYGFCDTNMVPRQENCNNLRHYTGGSLAKSFSPYR